MNISPISTNDPTATAKLLNNSSDKPSMREAFDNFVVETFFSQMMSSMRKSVEKPAYFHGGRAEEIFQGQLDKILSQEFTKSDGHSLSGSMYELFAASRR